MRTPAWDEVREFLKLDGWSLNRSTGHDHYEKVLPEGEILRTHASWAGDKTMSPGRFKAILSDQLRISEAQFWEVIRTGRPAVRPSPSPEPQPASIPLWLARALEREAGLSPDRIAELDEASARAIVDDVRSRRRE